MHIVPALICLPQLSSSHHCLWNTLPVVFWSSLPVIHGAGKHNANANILRGPNNGVIACVTIAVNIEEITDGSNPGSQHLCKGKTRSLVDRRLVHIWCIGVESFIPPGKEAAIVGDTTKHRL